MTSQYGGYTNYNVKILKMIGKELKNLSCLKRLIYDRFTKSKLNKCLLAGLQAFTLFFLLCL